MICKLSFVFLLLSIFWLHVAQTKSFYSPTSGKATVILNPKTQLVLDGSEETVKARRSINSSAQSWYINPADNGTSYIINKKTNNVLCLQRGFRSWDIEVATTGLNRTSEYQKWYVNPDGSIVNVGHKDLALTIYTCFKMVYPSTRSVGDDMQVFKMYNY